MFVKEYAAYILLKINRVSPISLREILLTMHYFRETWCISKDAVNIKQIHFGEK